MKQLRFQHISLFSVELQLDEGTIPRKHTHVVDMSMSMLWKTNIWKHIPTSCCWSMFYLDIKKMRATLKPQSILKVVKGWKRSAIILVKFCTKRSNFNLKKKTMAATTSEFYNDTSLENRNWIFEAQHKSDSVKYSKLIGQFKSQSGNISNNTKKQ